MGKMEGCLTKIEIGYADCSFILPQIKKVFEVLSSVKIKGKQYARPFILKYRPDDFYIKNISDNKYLNNQIQHVIKIK